MLTKPVIEVITAFLGTLGFGVLFHIRGKKLLWAAIGGMLSWLLFLLLGRWIVHEPARYLIVSILITIYSELLARIMKTPSTTFSVISLIPLVPGAGLYYTTTYALNGQSEEFLPELTHTIALAVALALGIVLVTAVFKHLKLKKPAKTALLK